MITIIYKDNDIVVAVKPVGVLSQPAESGSKGAAAEDMITLLGLELAREKVSGLTGISDADLKPLPIFPVHRLDITTGGVCVYARNHKAAAALSRAVEANELHKEYYAVCEGMPSEASGTWEDLLYRDKAKNKSFVVKRMRKGVRDAKLDYIASATADDSFTSTKRLTLLDIHLHTGRTHQIRVQCSSRGLPLTGDGKYGSKNNHCSVALWSKKLNFHHPRTGKEMTFTSTPPDTYPWNLFKF